MNSVLMAAVQPPDPSLPDEVREGFHKVGPKKTQQSAGIFKTRIESHPGHAAGRISAADRHTVRKRRTGAGRHPGVDASIVVNRIAPSTS